MISFHKIHKTEYRMSFYDGKSIDLLLLSRTSITNKFNIIMSFMEKMSRDYGSGVEDYIFYLLHKYQQYKQEDETAAFDFLNANIGNLVHCANYIIDDNAIDYDDFADETKRSMSSIFFNGSEIKRLIKFTAILKIYSLIYNTDKKLSKANHKLLYNRIAKSLQLTDTVDKIFDLLESQRLEHYGLRKNGTKVPSVNTVLKAFAHITSQLLTLCKHDENPIPFFIAILNNFTDWSHDAEIHYDDDVELMSDDDETDSSIDNIPPTWWSDSPPYTRKIRLENLNVMRNICYAYLRQRYDAYDLRLKGCRQAEALIDSPLKQIKYVSPFWDFILAPILSAALELDPYYLEREPPKTKAVISFYCADKLKSLFGEGYRYWFGLAKQYPRHKPPESTQYRLQNVGQFLNLTMSFKAVDLSGFRGSRIPLARFIEDFVGKMVGTRHFCRTLSGKDIRSPRANKVEALAIDYLVMLLCDGGKVTADALCDAISEDISAFNSVYNAVYKKTSRHKAPGEKPSELKEEVVAEVTQDRAMEYKMLPPFKCKSYLIYKGSFTVKEITGVMRKYADKLHQNTGIYLDVSRYFLQLGCHSGSTIYEDNKDWYFRLVCDYPKLMIRSRLFHSAFFAYNCIEVGKLINAHLDSEISGVERDVARQLIDNLFEKHHFLELCIRLGRDTDFQKYFFIGSEHLHKLITITGEDRSGESIEDRLSQFGIHLDHDDTTDVAGFVKELSEGIKRYSLENKGLWKDAKYIRLKNLRKG